MVQVTASLGSFLNSIVVECRVRQVDWSIMSEPYWLRVGLVTNVKVLGKVLVVMIVMGTVIINDMVVLIHELTMLVDSYFLANVA